MDNTGKKKSVWKNKLRPMWRAGIMTVAATVALSVPAISNTVGKVNVFKNLQHTVAHAETDNLMNSDDITTEFHVNHNDDKAHWTHTLNNSGDMKVSGPDFDLTDVTYVVKFPDKLSHLLEDEYLLDYLFGKVLNFDSAQSPFTLTGDIIDEDGNEDTIAKDTHKPYDHISINKETNSIEFNMESFYSDNKIEPYIRQNVNGEYIFNTLGFVVPIIVPDDRMLDNGTYEFKTAIVRGESVDLDDVSNAYSEELVVDYSTDPEPEPEEPEVDKSDLEVLFNEANEDYDKEDYTEESFAKLTEAIQAAEDVLNNEDATQDDVDEAMENLDQAIDGLVEADPEPEPEPEVNKDDLQSLIDDAKKNDSEDYTDESFANLTSAIEAAEIVIANDDATQDDVDKAEAKLAQAIENLAKPEPEPEVDTTQLEELVADANALNADNYTKDSFADVMSIVQTAEGLLESNEASQDDIDATVTALGNAIVHLVDLSELQAHIKEANNFKAEGFTDESFAGLTEAIETAEHILDTDDATQEQVEDALTTLQAAINDLKEAVEEDIVIDENEESEESVVEDDNRGEGERLPETATNTPTLLLIGSLLAIAGGTTLFIRRKKMI